MRKKLKLQYTEIPIGKEGLVDANTYAGADNKSRGTPLEIRKANEKEEKENRTNTYMG